MKFVFPLLTLVFATTASAAILHDNGAPNLINSARSDADNGVQRGDKLTVTTGETLQSIQWWGIYAFANTPQSVDAFTARIYSIVNGTPNQNPLVEIPLTVTRQATAQTIGGRTVYVYGSTIPNTILGPGDYVFSLMNDTTADTDDSWFWTLGTVTTAIAFERNAMSDPWNEFGADLVTPVPPHAFNISGLIVPEPTTFSLLAVAGLGLALKRNRKRFVVPSSAGRA
ncbi:MAG: PEP-CTERM sorting domain-containing protein [Chthoniobacteraceae bacterium]